MSDSPLLLPTQGDMHFYHQWAQRILHGQFTDHLAFYGLPLYAYLLALIYSVFGQGPFVPGLLQAACEAGTAILIYELGVRAFRTNDAERGPLSPDGSALATKEVWGNCSQFIGWMAALGWALFTPAQTYAVILMPTVWAVFVFWLLVWLVVRRDSVHRQLAWFGYGLLLGFAALGVATILLLVPLLVTAIVLKPNRVVGETDNFPRGFVPGRLTIFSGPKIIAALLLFAGIGIGTSPCWIHNYFIARDPVFLSAHSGVNLWIGNNAMATGYPRFPPGLHAGQEAMLEDSITAAEKAAGRSLKRSEVSAFWATKANDYIRNHFVAWLGLLAVKAKNFWNAFQYDDLSMVTILRENQIVFPGLRFGLVAALALPGLLIAWRRFVLSRWIALAILLHMLALLPVFVTERYRLAAVPGLLLFAACGLSIFWQACAAAHFRTAAIYVILLIGSSLFVAWPQRSPSLWALDYYNSGWRALEAHDLEKASQKLRIASAYVPDNAETQFALGNLRLAQNDRAAAKSFYVATLRLDPDHGGAYNNLGVLARGENQWDLAAKFFNEAMKRDPQDAKTYFLLAEAHFKVGEVKKARAEIHQALMLDPIPAEFRELQDQIKKSGP